LNNSSLNGLVNILPSECTICHLIAAGDAVSNTRLLVMTKEKRPVASKLWIKAGVLDEDYFFRP
jgi:hypothetical protein